MIEGWPCVWTTDLTDQLPEPAVDEAAGALVVAGAAAGAEVAGAAVVAAAPAAGVAAGAAGAAPPLSAAVAAGAGSLVLVVPELLSRKSVTYQPEPFS